MKIITDSTVLLDDPLIFEKENQEKGFASHRYDQTILSVIVRYYQKKIKITINDEESESNYENQIVKASRKIDKIEKNKITDFLKKIYYKING